MNKSDITNVDLRKFLERTDFMPFLEMKRIVERLFNKSDWSSVEEAESYEVLFGEGGSGSRTYENSEFQNFNENLEGFIEEYVHLPTEIPAEIPLEDFFREVRDSIFRDF